MENYNFILTTLLESRHKELTKDPDWRENLSKSDFRELQIITEALQFYKSDDSGLTLPSDLDCLLYALQSKLIKSPETTSVDDVKLLNALKIIKASSLFNK